MKDTVEEGMLAIAEKKLKLGENLCDTQQSKFQFNLFLTVLLIIFVTFGRQRRG